MSKVAVDIHKFYLDAASCPAEELVTKIENLKKELQIYEMVRADRQKLGEDGLGKPKRETKSKTVKSDSKTDASKVKQEVKSEAKASLQPPTPQVNNSAQVPVQSPTQNGNYQGQGYTKPNTVNNFQY